MPYGYYGLVRFVSMVGFGILAYAERDNSNKSIFIVYIILALLFQPFIKIALGRTLWNIVDVVVAIYLLLQLKTPTDKE